MTEWEEPQAVIGSYLQKYAYPDYWKLHVEQNGRELKNWVRGKFFDKKASGESQAVEEFRNVVKGTRDRVGCLQLRGEYMYVAEGKGGFRVVFDPVTQGYALWDPAGRRYLAYDDPRAVQAKGRFARAQGLAGVFAWELSQDNGDLLDAMNRGVGKVPAKVGAAAK